MKIRLDLQAHFWAGMAICLAVSLFLPPIFGLGVAVAASAAKEAWDYTGRGIPDIWDFVATTVGGLLGFGLLAIN